MNRFNHQNKILKNNRFRKKRQIGNNSQKRLDLY